MVRATRRRVGHCAQMLRSGWCAASTESLGALTCGSVRCAALAASHGELDGSLPDFVLAKQKRTWLHWRVPVCWN